MSENTNPVRGMLEQIKSLALTLGVSLETAADIIDIFMREKKTKEERATQVPEVERIQ